MTIITCFLARRVVYSYRLVHQYLEGLTLSTTIKKIIVLVIVISALALAGCTPTESTSCDDNLYSTQSRAQNTYEYSPNVEQFVYTVTDEMIFTRLHLTFEQTAGSVSWTFTNPNGEIVWEGSNDKIGDINEIREFDVITGDWELTLNLKDSAGSYDNCWMAK